MAELGTCQRHPRRKVPIEDLRKEPDNPLSVFFKCCSSCRRRRNDQRITAQKETFEEDGHLYSDCGEHHTAKVESPHPRERVPIELFRKVISDPKSRLFITCFHCRRYRNKHQ